MKHFNTAKPRRDIGGIFAISAAILLWVAFGVLCSGVSVATGLAHADDATLARVSKTLAAGGGYSFAGEGNAFDPGITTGPALLLPLALVLKAGGARETLPGLFTVAFWFAAFTFLFVRAARRTNPLSLLIGVAAFCFAVLAVFPFHFEHWHALLGEVPAAVLLLVAHWIAAFERPTRGWWVACGMCVGLAVLTKALAIIAALGVPVILAIRMIRENEIRRRWLSVVATLIGGCLLPIVAFELFKVTQLGFAGYAENWRTFADFFRGQAFNASGAEGSLTGTVRQRFVIVDQRLLTSRMLFIVAAGAIACAFGLRQYAKQWLALFAGISASMLVLGFYWLFFSIGWPRYLLIGIAMGCFLLALPLLAGARWWCVAPYSALIGVLLAPGIPRLAYVRGRADRGLFRPNSERVARAEIVAKINELQSQRDVTLGSRWPAEYAAVEFALPTAIRFENLETLAARRGRKFILVHKGFPLPDEAEYLRKTFTAALVPVLSRGPYDVLEVGDANNGASP